MTAFERNRYAPGAKEYFRIWGGNIQLIGKSYRLEMEVNLVRAAPLWRCKPVFSPAIPVFLTKDIRMQISIITHVRDTRTPAAGVYKLLVKELVSICAFYLMGTAAAMGSGSGGGGRRGGGGRTPDVAEPLL